MQSASSASSATASSSAASSAPAVSEYGTVDSFDYQNFTYSDGLDANGYRTGITAQDYVTLPDNVAALPIKKADVSPQRLGRPGPHRQPAEPVQHHPGRDRPRRAERRRREH